MAYETATAAAGQIKAETASSAIQNFDTVLARLEGLVERISNSADKIVGSRPSPVGKPETPPTPQHLIFQIQQRRNRLMVAVDHLENELGRIENGLE